MLVQIKESLRKFIGRSTITEDKKETVVKSEETFFTKEELALAIKNIGKKRGRTRYKSEGNQDKQKRKIQTTKADPL